jgi:outer membrane protein W
MRLKSAILVAAVAMFSIPAWSQDQSSAPNEYEASANITANLQGETTATGVTDRATYSGGLLLNFRYRFRGNLWFEANGGFTTFTQYYQPTAGQEQANIYEGTAGIVYKFRAAQDRLRPFVEAGGGVLYFSPVATGSTPGGQKVLQPNGFGGFGVDWKMNKSFSFRAGFRALGYKPPSFNVAQQTVNTFTIMSEPYIGLVLRF